MPQQQFVAGGDFSSALSELAKAKLADVRQELREVGKEIALITPSRNVPLSEQQAVRESGAAVFIGGASADASSPEVMPLLRTMGFSPFVPGAAPPPHPTLGLPGSQASSVPAAVVSLGDLTAALPPSPHAPGCHTSTGDGGGLISPAMANQRSSFNIQPRSPKSFLKLRIDGNLDGLLG